VIFGDRFYSVGELADVTGYHRDSIYRAIESGSLDAVKPGGRWLIAGSAINTWLYSDPVPRAEQRPAAVAAPPAGSTPRAPAPSSFPGRRTSPSARGSFRELARRSQALTQ
jgi:excisionase family DNA binding protein